MSIKMILLTEKVLRFINNGLLIIKVTQAKGLSQVRPIFYHGLFYTSKNCSLCAKIK